MTHVRWFDVAGDNAASIQPATECDAFFGRPDDHLQRVARAQIYGSQRLDHAQRGERSQVTVEVAAVRNRINVRAEEDRRQGRVGASAASEDISGLVHPGIKTGRTHQAHRVPATSDIVVRVRDAAHTIGERTARRSAEHAERFEPLSQRRRIDTSRHVLGKYASAQPDRPDRGRRETRQKHAPGRIRQHRHLTTSKVSCLGA